MWIECFGKVLISFDGKVDVNREGVIEYPKALIVLNGSIVFIRSVWIHGFFIDNLDQCSMVSALQCLGAHNGLSKDDFTSLKTLLFSAKS